MPASGASRPEDSLATWRLGRAPRKCRSACSRPLRGWSTPGVVSRVRPVSARASESNRVRSVASRWNTASPVRGASQPTAPCPSSRPPFQWVTTVSMVIRESRAWRRIRVESIANPAISPAPSSADMVPDGASAESTLALASAVPLSRVDGASRISADRSSRWNPRRSESAPSRGGNNVTPPSARRWPSPPPTSASTARCSSVPSSFTVPPSAPRAASAGNEPCKPGKHQRIEDHVGPKSEHLAPGIEHHGTPEPTDRTILIAMLGRSLELTTSLSGPSRVPIGGESTLEGHRGRLNRDGAKIDVGAPQRLVLEHDPRGVEAERTRQRNPAIAPPGTSESVNSQSSPTVIRSKKPSACNDPLTRPIEGKRVEIRSGNVEIQVGDLEIEAPRKPNPR